MRNQFKRKLLFSFYPTFNKVNKRTELNKKNKTNLKKRIPIKKILIIYQFQLQKTKDSVNYPNKWFLKIKSKNHPQTKTEEIYQTQTLTNFSKTKACQLERTSSQLYSTKLTTKTKT